MSFKFNNWPQFDDNFYEKATELLETAMNKGPKPSHICDQILVKDLNMGSIPPDLEILEIGELTNERFRGIFRLSYSGDAYLILQTKVQVNPVTSSYDVMSPTGSLFSSSYSPGILSAHKPLIMPLQLTLSKLKLDAVTFLSFSKQNGITLNFKNDPLKSVSVSSSFDNIHSVKEKLAIEIEGRLQEVLKEVLPKVLYEWSMKEKEEIDSAYASQETGLDREANIDDQTPDHTPLPSPISKKSTMIWPSPNLGLPPAAQVGKNAAGFFSSLPSLILPTGFYSEPNSPVPSETQSFITDTKNPKHHHAPSFTSMPALNTKEKNQQKQKSPVFDHVHPFAGGLGVRRKSQK